jgi:hypothetical protein
MEIPEELEIYFKERNVQIKLYPEETVYKFSTLREVYDFIKKEYEFWNECTNGKTSEIRTNFSNIYSNLNNLINRFSANNANSHYQELLGHINSITRIGFPNIYSISSYGQFIKEKYMESLDNANGVIDFLFGNSINNLSNAKYFKGVLSAYTLKNSEVAFTKYEDTQDLTITKLKEQYLESINVLHDEYLNKNREVNNTYIEFSNQINSWKDNTTKNTNDFLEEKKNKLIELEKTYEEKLKLKAPAEYWDKLREEYENKGNMWRKFSMGTALFLIIMLISILYKMPESLKVDINQFKFEDFRATLILTIAVSTCIYMLRLFVKLSLSAYHLSRDAKERYQLTYVYLSLLNEGSISESERNIVFQALFSRADTGLLKGDSSPTLPDGLIQQVTKLVAK